MKTLTKHFVCIISVLFSFSCKAQTSDSSTFLIDAITIYTSRGYAKLIDYSTVKPDWPSAEIFFKKYPFFSLCQIGNDTVIVNNISSINKIEIIGDTIPYNLVISRLEFKNPSIIHMSLVNPINRHIEFNLCKFPRSMHISFDTLNYLGFQENKKGTVHLRSDYISNFFMDDNKLERIWVNAKMNSMSVVRDTTLKYIGLGESQISELSLGNIEAIMESSAYPENKGFEISADGIESCVIDKLFLRGNFSESSHFDISNLHIKYMYHYGNKIPDHFLFYNSRLDIVSGFEARENWLSPKSIYIYNSDLSSINIDFSRTKIDKLIHNQNRNGDLFNQSLDDINGLYKRRMDICRKKGQSDILYHLEMQYYDFYYFEYRKGILSTISYYMQKWWWDFGHKERYILRNTGIIYFLFFFLNTFLIRKLSSRVYSIEDIRKRAKKSTLSLSQRLMLSCFYTAIVFFGLKLEIDRFKFKNFLGVLYVFIIYGIGLVCLAFLANWIFSF